MAKNGAAEASRRKRRIFRLVLLVVVAGSVLAGVLLWPELQPRLAALGLAFRTIQAAEAPLQASAMTQSEATTAWETISPSPSASATLSSTPSEAPPSETALPEPLASTSTPSAALAEGAAWATAFSPLDSGLLIAAYNENGYSRLFAFHPQGEPFTRLTYGAWDDVAPDLNPDGTRLAFASNRDGQWDLYVLDLSSGDTNRLTETATYEGSPSWSPDGRWLAYEAYVGDPQPDLEIFIRPLDDSQEPLQLTDNTEADYQPAWSPGGRQIAFVSDRSGENEIWLADLDQFTFTNLSRDETAIEDHPAWSPDGRHLAWTSMNGTGMHNLLVWDANQPLEPARLLASGNWPAWSPNGLALATGYASPNQDYLTGFASSNGGLALAPYPIPGELNGLTWGNGRLPDPLPENLQQATAQQPGNLWLPALTPGGDIPGGRRAIVEVADIEAPYALMQDMVDEAFKALRQKVAQAAGWDLLSNLENAFVPLTDPLPPGMGDDWLYTGRAFAFNTTPINAGWLVVVREDYGPQTYWRVYIKARFQDGSQGQPLKQIPWDFNARLSGDPLAYERGGDLAKTIPAGYWVDLTALANAYGWQRQPALSTWRASYNAARFNEFAFTGGLDWASAMLEIYPPELLVTPTALVPTTAVPSRTPRPSITPTPTRTPRPTRTLTPSPTPRPSFTPTP